MININIYFFKSGIVAAESIFEAIENKADSETKGNQFQFLLMKIYHKISL